MFDWVSNCVEGAPFNYVSVCSWLETCAGHGKWFLPLSNPKTSGDALPAVQRTNWHHDDLGMLIAPWRL